MTQRRLLWRRMRAVAALSAMLGLVPHLAYAQAIPPKAPVVQLRWGNADFALLVGDKAVELSVWPSALMRQRGVDASSADFLIPRDSVHGWTDDVRYIIGERRPAPTASLADWTAVLRGLPKGEVIMAGQDPGAPRLEPPFYLMVRNEAKAEPLTFRVPKDRLLRLLEVMDSLADAPRTDFGWGLPLRGDGTTVESTPGEEGVEPITFGKLEMPRNRFEPGSVVLYYVVDSTGAVDETRMRVGFSDGDDLVKSAVRAILGSKFKAARTNGRPVSQIVVQRLVFMFSRPGE